MRKFSTERGRPAGAGSARIPSRSKSVMQPECAKPTESRSSAASATASSTGAASRPQVDAPSRSLISSRAGYNPSPPLRARLSVADQLRESHQHKTFTHLRESLEIYIGLNDRAMIARSFTELTDTPYLRRTLPECNRTGASRA